MRLQLKPQVEVPISFSIAFRPWSPGGPVPYWGIARRYPIAYALMLLSGLLRKPLPHFRIGQRPREKLPPVRFEPQTLGSAVECSTVELHPRLKRRKEISIKISDPGIPQNRKLSKIWIFKKSSEKALKTFWDQNGAFRVKVLVHVWGEIMQ